MAHQSRSFRITERWRIPLDGKIFGWLPILPMVAGACLMVFPTEITGFIAAAMALWGSVIILFLAGVRRGLSFRTPGGPRAIQLVTMMGFFLWGLVALVLPPVPALWFLAVGYGVIAVIDPIAARREEAPLYFAHLRPVQMGCAALMMLTGACLASFS